MIAAYLGIKSFYWASPPAEIYQQDIEALQFPGTDGADFRLLGFHSRDWQLETLADFANSSLAYDELEAYRDLIEEAPQQFIHYNNDFDNRGFRVKVMRVTPGNSRQRGGVKAYVEISGGRFAGNLVIAAATWTLRWTRY
jgi:hypothetical protein